MPLPLPGCDWQDEVHQVSILRDRYRHHLCLHDRLERQERPNVRCIGFEGLAVLPNIEDGADGSQR